MAGKEEEFSAPMEHESKSVSSDAIGVCGSLKRKAEQTEEARTVDVVVVGLPDSSEQLVRFLHDSSSEEDDMVYSDDSDEFDSDEDPETIFAKIKARFEAHFRECEARFSAATYKGDSHSDDKDELDRRRG